jgi:hypothetical protein
MGAHHPANPLGRKELSMKHTIIALAAAGLMAAALPSAAQARCDGCAVGAGVIGGLAAGAIIGGAIANSQPHYYEPAPVYVAPPPPPRYVEEYDDGPVCHTERRRVWVDGYGWERRRVRVCE